METISIQQESLTKEISNPKQLNNEKGIYILLSKTHTLPSKVIGFLNPMPYVHTSIAFDEDLEEMYSFARKKIHWPFYCGLIDEDINAGIFARHKSTNCLVLRLPVTWEQYQKIKDAVESFKMERKKYGYNYLGVFACKFHKALERKYDYFCSQFVDKVLQMSGINLFGKSPGLVTPEDYRKSDKLEHFYEGLLSNYRTWLQGIHVAREEKAQRRLEKRAERKSERKNERLEKRIEKKTERDLLKEQRRLQRREERERSEQRQFELSMQEQLMDPEPDYMLQDQIQSEPGLMETILWPDFLMNNQESSGEEPAVARIH